MHGKNGTKPEQQRTGSHNEVHDEQDP
jgi:hypothetical protein